MPHEEILAVPKNAFLVGSILIYFLCLLFTERYSSREIPERKRFYLSLGIGFVLYSALIALTYRNGKISIAVTVIFIFAQVHSMKKGVSKKQNVT